MNQKDRLYAMRKLNKNFLLHKYTDESLHESGELRMLVKHRYFWDSIRKKLLFRNVDILHAFVEVDGEFSIVTEWYKDGSLSEVHFIFVFYKREFFI